MNMQQKKQVPYPQYKECTLGGPEFVIQCHFMNLKAEGRALNKKIAKQNAAKQLLDRVNTEDIIYTSNSYSSSNDLIDDDMMQKILSKYSSLQISNEPLKADIPVALPIVEKLLMERKLPHLNTMNTLIKITLMRHLKLKVTFMRKNKGNRQFLVKERYGTSVVWPIKCRLLPRQLTHPHEQKLSLPYLGEVQLPA